MDLVNLNGSIDMYLSLTSILLSSIGSYFILRPDRKNLGISFWLPD